MNCIRNACKKMAVTQTSDRKQKNKAPNASKMHRKQKSFKNASKTRRHSRKGLERHAFKHCTDAMPQDCVDYEQHMVPVYLDVHSTCLQQKNYQFCKNQGESIKSITLKIIRSLKLTHQGSFCSHGTLCIRAQNLSPKLLAKP